VSTASELGARGPREYPNRFPVLLLLSALLCSPAASDEPVEPGARYERREGATFLWIEVPGHVVSYALPVGPTGTREILLLVAPPAEPETEPSEDDDESDEVRRLPACPEESEETASRPLSLYRFDPGGSDELQRLDDALPKDATALDAADLDGDGDDELLLARPGELFWLDLAGPAGPVTLRPLVQDPDLSWKRRHPRAIRRPELEDTAWAVSAGLGSLQIYGPVPEEERWEQLARVELPLEADLRGNGIRLSSPVPRFIGRDAEGRWLFATPPQSIGSSRVGTMLIAATPAGEVEVTQCWAHLPTPEQVLDESFVMIDDQPMLLVGTKPADKLNLFGEKQLRLYRLRRDRSRLGFHPEFAAESRMNLWQDAVPRMIDVNGDGAEDLVIGYWKGIFKSRVVLDAYLRGADGSFSTSPRNTAIDVKKGEEGFLHYGSDLNGNGHPDLLVRDEEHVLIYAGRASTDGKQLVDTKKPHRVEAHNEPLLADLDGDGRPELLFLSGGRFQAIWPYGR